MLKATTKAIAKLLNARPTDDVEFKGVFTDTRKPLTGGLFVALKGANFDGHDYTKQAEDKGATAIIAARKINSQLPVVQVEDTTAALGKIAQFHRQKSRAKVVAITGSNGKTTTKNMLANILSLQAPTLKTEGSLNNHFGVPMTLLKLEKKHQYAVIEMGANHLGEVAQLREMVTPNIAVVTNTADAHIGGFGGFDNLVCAKGEIYSKHSKNIVNTQTTFSGDISFGNGGNIFASNIVGCHFDLHINNQQLRIALPLIGKHNIDNALAASACAYALNIDIKTIKQGLENTRPEAGRLNILSLDKFTLIDDTYNASPYSTIKALEALQTFAGEKVAVLGSMAELGETSAQQHTQIGKLAKITADAFYSHGELAKHYHTTHFDDKQQLANHLLAHHIDATVLIKGSRMMGLDELVKLLKQ